MKRATRAGAIGSLGGGGLTVPIVLVLGTATLAAWIALADSGPAVAADGGAAAGSAAPAEAPCAEPERLPAVLLRVLGQDVPEALRGEEGCDGGSPR